MGLLGTFSVIIVYLGLAFWAFRLLSGTADSALRLVGGLGFTLLLHCQVFWLWAAFCGWYPLQA